MSETEKPARVDHQPFVRLLPCPFCGSPAKTYHDSVTCSNRECKMHYAAVPDMHAPEEWNRQDGCITCGAYELANNNHAWDVEAMQIVAALMLRLIPGFDA